MMPWVMFYLAMKEAQERMSHHHHHHRRRGPKPSNDPVPQRAPVTIGTRHFLWGVAILLVLSMLTNSGSHF